MAELKTDKDDAIFTEAKDRFDKTLDFYMPEYERGEEDVEFANGEQWDASTVKDRDGRPCLTENHCMPFIEQVVNGARETRPSVKVAPVDDEGDPKTAETFKGLIRNIERQSKASIAYDMGVQNAVSSGYGWLRVETDYTDPLSFTQEAKITSVPDWKSAMLDPSSEMIDGSDAEYGFIYKDIEKKIFEDEYPDHDPMDFDGTESEDEDKVRIVEYFYKQYEEKELVEVFLKDGTTRALLREQVEEIPEEYFAYELQSRQTKIPTVKWCKLYGGGILETSEWLGQYIPIIPVYGKRIWRDGRLKSYSFITHAKDVQRMLNTIISTIAEVVAAQPKNQPHIGAVGQFDSDPNWVNANTANLAVLQYDPVWVTDEATGQSMLAPPPQKSMPMQVSPALFQIYQNAVQSMNAALGMYEENRGDESNAISGVAIKSRQLRGDKSTFHFIDNLACSIRHVGVVLVDLIPKLYNTKQVKRIVGTDDKEKTITVDPSAQTNADEGIYNLNAGKYDVDVDVGPSYATQQQEFLDISKTMMQADPTYVQVAGDKMIEAAGGPHAEVIAERLRANMPPAMQSDDPMAAKMVELMKQLEASQKELEMAMAALDNKRKNEEFENQIKSGELKVKATDSETKRIETLAKIEEMKLKAQGAESEALADFADAIMEMDAEQQSVRNALPMIMSKLSQIDMLLAQQAKNPPEGSPPQ